MGKNNHPINNKLHELFLSKPSSFNEKISYYYSRPRGVMSNSRTSSSTSPVIDKKLSVSADQIYSFQGDVRDIPITEGNKNKYLFIQKGTYTALNFNELTDIDKISSNITLVKIKSLPNYKKRLQDKLSEKVIWTLVDQPKEINPADYPKGSNKIMSMNPTAFLTWEARYHKAPVMVVASTINGKIIKKSTDEGEELLTPKEFDELSDNDFLLEYKEVKANFSPMGRASAYTKKSNFLKKQRALFEQQNTEVTIPSTTASTLSTTTQPTSTSTSNPVTIESTSSNSSNEGVTKTRRKKRKNQTDNKRPFKKRKFEEFTRDPSYQNSTAISSSRADDSILEKTPELQALSDVIQGTLSSTMTTDTTVTIDNQSYSIKKEPNGQYFRVCLTDINDAIATPLIFEWSHKHQIWVNIKQAIESLQSNEEGNSRSSTSTTTTPNLMPLTENQKKEKVRFKATCSSMLNDAKTSHIALWKLIVRWHKPSESDLDTDKNWEKAYAAFKNKCDEFRIMHKLHIANGRTYIWLKDSDDNFEIYAPKSAKKKFEQISNPSIKITKRKVNFPNLHPNRNRDENPIEVGSQFINQPFPISLNSMTPQNVVSSSQAFQPSTNAMQIEENTSSTPTLVNNELYQYQQAKNKFKKECEEIINKTEHLSDKTIQYTIGEWYKKTFGLEFYTTNDWDKAFKALSDKCEQFNITLTFKAGNTKSWICLTDSAEPTWQKYNDPANNPFVTMHSIANTLASFGHFATQANDTNTSANINTTSQTTSPKT